MIKGISGMNIFKMYKEVDTLTARQELCIIVVKSYQEAADAFFERAGIQHSAYEHVGECCIVLDENIELSEITKGD